MHQKTAFGDKCHRFPSCHQTSRCWSTEGNLEHWP